MARAQTKGAGGEGAVCVVVSGSPLLHDFLRSVLADAETDASQPIRVAAMREAA